MSKRQPAKRSPECVVGSLFADLRAVRALPLEMRLRVAAVLALEAADLRSEPPDEQRIGAYLVRCPELDPASGDERYSGMGLRVDREPAAHDPNVAVESSRA